MTEHSTSREQIRENVIRGAFDGVGTRSFAAGFQSLKRDQHLHHNNVIQVSSDVVRGKYWGANGALCCHMRLSSVSDCNLSGRCWSGHYHLSVFIRPRHASPTVVIAEWENVETIHIYLRCYFWPAKFDVLVPIGCFVIFPSAFPGGIIDSLASRWTGI